MDELGTSTFILDDGEEEEQRIYGFWHGFVTNNADPTGRARVRVSIPGLNVTESTWAEQVGGPGAGSSEGGGKSHGMWSVPKVSSNVVVAFIQGDVDHPIYFPGPFPINGLPTNASPDNILLQTDDFKLSMLQNNGGKKFRLETLLPDIPDQSKEIVRSVIEIDINAGSAGKSHVINITAPSAISITSKGSINIDAPIVSIKGRNVMPSDRPL